MSEKFPIEIEFKGIDDVSDELQNIGKNMQSLNENLNKTSEQSFKLKTSVSDVDEALKRNNITLVQNAEEAQKVLKESSANQKAFKALAEEAKVFSYKAEFAAKQLGNIASFGAKVNSIFNSINTAMTRVNTAQTNLNLAQERQRQLLDEINAKFGIHASSLDEAAMKLEELRGYYLEGERSTKELDAALKEITNTQNALKKAQDEVIASQQQFQAQLISIGIQAIGLVPSFISVVNSISTLGGLFPGLMSGIKAVGGAFTSLYAAMGPVGLILIAVGAAVGLLIAYWDQIEPILRQVADTIWNAVGPAFTWIWENILKPFIDFLVAVVMYYIDQFIGFWKSVGDAVNKAGEGLQWVWDNIFKPLADFLANKFKNDIEAWINAFLWAKQQIENIFNAIRDIVKNALNFIIDKINEVKNKITGAFEWLKKQLVGGSIIPDMWSDITYVTSKGIEATLSEMEKLGLISGPTIRGPISISVAVNASVSSPQDWDAVAEKISRIMLLRLRTM